MKISYKFVETEILNVIKKYYNLDFHIFNYDPETQEIFRNWEEEKRDN